MLKGETLTNYEPERLIAKTRDRSLSSLPIFVLCDTCYWCATYFDKIRIPVDDNCPQCNANNNELTSFPIMSNESFTFDYNDKLGVELEFMPRWKDSNS
jgi:predicted Zn-ribbon and HTH transcriptional regulator